MQLKVPKNTLYIESQYQQLQTFSLLIKSLPGQCFSKQHPPNCIFFSYPDSIQNWHQIWKVSFRKLNKSNKANNISLPPTHFICIILFNTRVGMKKMGVWMRYALSHTHSHLKFPYLLFTVYPPPMAGKIFKLTPTQLGIHSNPSPPAMANWIYLSWVLPTLDSSHIHFKLHYILYESLQI